jgi:hypothetical protein
MGGRGSGRWDRWDKRSTLDDLLRLDIRTLSRDGALTPGASAALTWSRGAPYHVPLDWTQLHGGGQRAWFRCPACRRRVAVLYRAGHGFVCRHCARLPYGSQCESALDRGYRKVRKMRSRLGASHNLLKPTGAWHKPHGMHWRTFERLLMQEHEAHLHVLQTLVGAYTSLTRA